jgi:hypothetical protein
MKRLLSYVAAYLLWIIAAALGVWFMLLSRSALLDALALYAGDSVVRGWQTRFLDKVSAIVIGLLWLAAVIVIEVYFRRGVRQHALLGRFDKVAGLEFLVIFVTDVLLLWVQMGSESWWRWLILGGELVLGVALIWIARSIKTSKLGKTAAGGTV